MARFVAPTSALADNNFYLMAHVRPAQIMKKFKKTKKIVAKLIADKTKYFYRMQHAKTVQCSKNLKTMENYAVRTLVTIPNK